MISTINNIQNQSDLITVDYNYVVALSVVLLVVGQEMQRTLYDDAEDDEYDVLDVVLFVALDLI